nr:PREDICTED: lysosomal alpha-glucosidase-like isoform X1 [Megachile rotundata]XP_012150823.1 PREDICTED: lysosomal alpha-glucosidase-like isoform X1 [Megachile rotundata]XP_012150824.1 PREDICTED: lysosomal alpha-glucosidase-like isoform X1 [Megachile rotundata]
MDANKANNVTLRNMFSRKYFKYIFPCDLFRLILTIIVLCILILVVKETKYIVVQQYEINIIIKDIHEVVDEKWKYNVTLEEMPGTIQCNNIPVGLRFDCHPEDGASELSCKSRGCCWNPINKQISKIKRAPLNVPYCYYSKNWTIYKYENYSKEGNEFIGFLKQTGNSFYENDLPFVKVEISSVDDSILRVKMYDPSKTRYEPPWPVRPDPKPFTRKNINAKYKLDIDNTKLGFKVYRTSDDTTIFDSFNVGGFIFANQFLQISALLPTHNIYGIGEHQTGLKLNTNWQSFTLFNKDQPPIENANLYGSHPFYLMMENSGKSHGVLFLNSNAMDVILQPSPGITFRSIGGIFDMYIFLGPSPADVVRQYSEIVGKPFLPPYWSLGFHLCRYGYKTLEETKKVWNRTVAAEIPFDTQWNDLDYMDKNNDFTYNLEKFKDLPKFVKELHSRGMHYIPLIDAGISGSESNGSYAPYDEGLKEDLLVKDAAINRPFVGKVWNMISTVWPDFTNPKTPEYYFRMMRNLHNSFPFDGAWIDMNEPSNFYNGGKEGCTKNDLDYPKYVPNVIEGLLATKTLCMNAKHYLGNHYDLHNTYGIGQAVATNYALRKIRGKRPFIISRSSWVGQGHYSGHWTGDVYSCWHDLRMSISAILSSNFYQIPMVGADICGFNGNATIELCNRWMQLGAFYPFSRNHNSDDTIEQDPVAMGDLVVNSAKRALRIRYWLLPYLYTLFFRAHKFGETVARPLFFEFPSDSNTYDIDAQFLWGSSLMIVPVLEEGKKTVTAYLPRGPWYDLYTRNVTFGVDKYYTLNAPLDIIPLMIRGGSILPVQRPATTTTESRKNDLELLIALDHVNKAKGELYWDDGDSLDSYEKEEFVWLLFEVENDTLSSYKAEKKSRFKEKIALNRIEIWGIRQNVTQVYLNGRKIPFDYDNEDNYLDAANLQIDPRNEFKLSWK